MSKLVSKLGLVAVMATVIALGPLSVPAAFAQSSSGETFRHLKLFGDVFERVRNEYVEEVSEQELIEAAINGMLTSLDPHSGYLDPSRYRDMQVQTRGEFGGLGIEVTMENGLVKVVSPIDDTPAWRAGIEAGDLITHIDGEAVMGMTLGEAVEKMRGPVETGIDLRIVREGRDEPLEISLERDTITISPVRSRAEGDIGYVRITTFNEQTHSVMREQVSELQEEIGEEMRGVVLDLRNNPGGLLDQAVAVADAFLDQGEIVSTRGRRSDSVQRFNARDGDILDGLPIVVLINGGSASASEIVAGALQDHRRGIVMGIPSFGKGSVQTIMPISGQGAIRLTTARYYTPAGTSIQAKGITPDIEVHQARVEHVDDDNGRREAELRGRLENRQIGAEALDSAEEEDGEELDVQDYQLARAIDLLRGIALYEARIRP